MKNNRKIIYLYISSTFIFLIKINVCLMTPIDVKSNKFCKNAIFSFLKEVESDGILLRTRTKKKTGKKHSLCDKLVYLYDQVHRQIEYVDDFMSNAAQNHE